MPPTDHTAALADSIRLLAHELHHFRTALASECARFVRGPESVTQTDLILMERKILAAIQAGGISAEDGRLLDAALDRSKRTAEALERLDAETP